MAPPYYSGGGKKKKKKSFLVFKFLSCTTEMFMTNFIIHVYILVLVVYNFGEIAINALLHFSLRGEYWNFILSHRSRALLSSVLWTVYCFDFSSVDVNEIHFTVNYLSSQFTSKVLSKRLLMNSICSLFWVFSKHPGRLHFYFGRWRFSCIQHGGSIYNLESRQNHGN